MSGLKMSCFHWASAASKKVFSSGQCTQVKNILRTYCFCGRRRNLRGNDEQEEEGLQDEYMTEESLQDDQEYLAGLEFIAAMEQEYGERALAEEEETTNA